MNRHVVRLLSWNQIVLAVICLGVLIAASSGCGSNTGASNSSTAEKETKPKNESKPKKTESSTTSGTSNGPKTIGGIPYDVFFDKPLVIAANQQTGAGTDTKMVATDKGASAPGVEAPANGGTTNVTKTPAKDAGGVSLKDMINKDALANEVKAVRNYLAGKTGSVATYNTSYLEISPEAATLAVLAVAVTRYPEDFSWKKNAKHLRDLSFKIMEITTSKDAKNKNSFEAVSEAFAKIDDILKGSEPAGLPEAEEDKDYGDAVGGNVVMLMKRIKKAEETLKASVSSEAGLKKDADRVAQEGAILTFLGEVIKTQGFGWGGDEEFAKYAKPLIDGGKEIAEAAKSGNYAQYGEGIAKVAKSCNECHPKFKP
ncbi:MAG: cytochrome c [Planctomycetia bacterium]|nr:cytochrome c [Planctomycetia bacterium]